MSVPANVGHAPDHTARRRELRLEKSETVTRMFAEGMVGREIADATGFALKYVYELRDDPDGSKTRARKNRFYARRVKPCVDCGEPTNGDTPPTTGRCWSCQKAAATVWPREAMIAAAREWHDTFGDPPTVADWNGAPSMMARNPGAQLRRADAKDAGLRWPASSLVVARFGSWNEFIAAGGWEPLPVGRKYSERSMEPRDLIQERSAA